MTDIATADLVSHSREVYTRVFGGEAEIITSAPGRLNFGGEHCDYKGGYVLPFPTVLRGVAAGRRVPGKHCRVYSEYFDEIIEFDCDEALERGPKGEWANYYKGMCHFYLPEMPEKQLGFDMVFISNVTIGGGISSSAAVEISCALFIEKCLGIDLDPKDRAMRAYHAEHEFVQMPCGVMDQLISACGKYGHISLIDCISHDMKDYPINPNADPNSSVMEWPVTLLKLYVHVEHKLVNSGFADRVRECTEGENILKAKYNVDGQAPVIELCRGVTMEMLEGVKDQMSETVYKRCFHMLRETDRTLAYVDLILKADWESIGKLFFQSYDDSVQYFKNDHPDITTCINVLKEIGLEGGVYGGRMIGGGWGGSILCIVKKGMEDQLIPLIQKRCDEELHRPNSCDVMIIKEAGDGARVEYVKACFVCCEQIVGMNWIKQVGQSDFCAHVW